MNEFRASNNTPQPVIDELTRVFTSLGVSIKEVSREGWSYNPKTGYLRFKVFQLNPEGDRQINPFKKEVVTSKRVRKLSPFWRKRLEFVFSQYKDEETKGVPR